MIRPRIQKHIDAWNLGAEHAIEGKPPANPFLRMSMKFMHYNNGYQSKQLFKMNRIDIINQHIQKYGYKNYLEIGVQAGHCFRAVQCLNKTGVDPDTSSAALIHKTSDAFFKGFMSGTEMLFSGDNMERINKFDIIFIDGLHHADQVERDIINSLACLADGGTILMHDCKPTTEFMQRIPLTIQNEWTGDCWKAFVKLRTEREDLEMKVVDCDWGVGIIRPGKQELLKVDVPLTYENFVANQNEWLNLVPVNQFKP